MSLLTDRYGRHGPVASASTSTAAKATTPLLWRENVPAQRYLRASAQHRIGRQQERNDSTASGAAAAAAASEPPSPSSRKRKRGSVVDFSRKALRRVSECSVADLSRDAVRRVSEFWTYATDADDGGLCGLGSLVSWITAGNESADDDDGPMDEDEDRRTYPPFWEGLEVGGLEEQAFMLEGDFSDSSDSTTTADLIERLEGSSSAIEGLNVKNVLHEGLEESHDTGRHWPTYQEMAVVQALEQGAFEEEVIENRFQTMDGNRTTTDEQEIASEQLRRIVTTRREESIRLYRILRDGHPWNFNGSAVVDSDDAWTFGL